MEPRKGYSRGHEDSHLRKQVEKGDGLHAPEGSSPGGGRLRLSLEGVPPASMKRLGEIFETLATVINAGAASEVDLEISDPDEQCLFMQALRQVSARR